jgi:hypothetical protein
MQTKRINIRRLTLGVLVSLVLPLVIVVLLDLNLGLTPLLTIVASVVLIPLSSIIVIRSVLSELDRVIQEVAPLEIDSQE